MPPHFVCRCAGSYLSFAFRVPTDRPTSCLPLSSGLMMVVDWPPKEKVVTWQAVFTHPFIRGEPMRNGRHGPPTRPPTKATTYKILRLTGPGCGGFGGCVQHFQALELSPVDFRRGCVRRCWGCHFFLFSLDWRWVWDVPSVRPSCWAKRYVCLCCLISAKEWCFLAFYFLIFLRWFCTKMFLFGAFGCDGFYPVAFPVSFRQGRVVHGLLCLCVRAGSPAIYLVCL